eukprot:6439942-Amphidinium_carterae.1
MQKRDNDVIRTRSKLHCNWIGEAFLPFSNVSCTASIPQPSLLRTSYDIATKLAQINGDIK